MSDRGAPDNLFPPIPYVIHHESPSGARGCTFALDDASLTLGIGPDNVVVWVWANGDGTHDSGKGVIWLNGRLTSAGDPDSLRFYDVVHRKAGLSFGTIEAELRAITQYEGP